MYQVPGSSYRHAAPISDIGPLFPSVLLFINEVGRLDEEFHHNIISNNVETPTYLLVR